MTRRWLRIAALAALLVAVGLAGTWAARHFATDDRSLAVTGTIEATQVDVSAKITGRIVELTVREGQPVERGQLLVRLDTEELAADLRRSEAAVRTAAAQLRDLQAGARPQEIREAEAQAARAQSQLDDLLAGARVQDVERAPAELRNAVATREWAERDHARAQELFGKQLVAAQEVDRARQAYEVARANEDSARERLALVEAGPRKDEVEGARAAVRAARERVGLLRAGPRAEAVAAAEAQVVEARAAHTLAQARLAETRLTSPISGVASDPMVATSAMNAATALAAQRSLEVLTQTLEGVTIRMPPVDFRVRAWYNPDLVSAIFIVPGLVGALLMQTTITQMAVSIVREREKGTLEALIVSPVRRWELLLGKIIPNLLVAYGQMTMALLVAHYVFDVPIRGSLLLLYTLALLFMWGTLGIGIFVSAASRTVPQAMQLAFLTFLPSIYLSGLLFPVEGMPRAAQYLANVIPLTYFLKIVRGIVLKGVGLDLLLPSLLPLALFGGFVFSASILRFRKQLD